MNRTVLAEAHAKKSSGAPCLNCKERSVSCHASCSRYENYKRLFKINRADFLKRHDMEVALEKYR